MDVTAVNEREDEQDDSTQVLVALCVSNKQLGVACYEELQNSLYVDSMNMCVDSIEEIMNNMKATLKPTMFLLHPQIIVNKSLLELILSDADGTPDRYRFKVLKTAAWVDKSCQYLIHNCIQVRGSNSGNTSYPFLASVLDLEIESSRQALGALIGYMQQTVFKLDDGKVIVSTVKTLHLESYLKMDKQSFKALQIFSEETHPNVIKGPGRSKEGFSLFGLFDRTHSQSGRQKLKEWMLMPYYDKAKILYRQAGVALMSRPSNREYVRSVQSVLRHFHELPRLVLRVKKVEYTHLEWCKIHLSLVTAWKVLELTKSFINDNDSREDTADSDYLRQYYESVEVEMVAHTIMVLESAIDFKGCDAEGAIVFREDYDRQLDELQSTYDHLETHLVGAAHRVLDVVPLLENVSVEYVSQIGYLVAVQDIDLHLLSAYIRPRTRGDGCPQDYCDGYDGQDAVATVTAEEEAETDSFVFVYKQDGIHYYKHAIVCELDRTIGDIKSLISDRRKALMLGLEDLVLDAEQQLQQLSTVVSTIDALISLGTLAVEQSLVCPEIAEDPVILIKGGRHLLQQLTVDAFIPNDTCISADKNVALITGPNTSGKSVYLKQVALIVYLAHIGSFVPCEKARIGLTDAILTRINSVETVSAPQSAFALDLQQMSKMLRSHTKRSLCVIDEFGKGTTPVDGIALLAATVKHFALHKGSAIFVLHFTEIMDDQILSNQLMRSISCFQMQTYNPRSRSSSSSRGGGGGARGAGDDYCEAEDPSDWDECAPLFKLHRGVAQSSQGIACAKSAGVDETILQRASYIKSCVLSHSAIRPIVNTQALDAIRDNARLITLFLSTNNWLQDGSQEGIDKLQEMRTC